jgi:hypothetical protein
MKPGRDDGKGRGPIMPADGPTVEDLIGHLHRAGWSIGDVATTGVTGARSWVVTGSHGEDLIRAEGPTRVAAWLQAVEQARGLGMPGRPVGY